MITHLYVAKLKPETPPERVRTWLAEIDRLEIEGMRGLWSGTDLRIREGNYDVAITAEFADAAAWRRYDQDDLHNQIRAEHARPIVEAQRRVQFESGAAHVPGEIRNVTLIDFRPEAGDGFASGYAVRLAGLRVNGMRWIDAGADLGMQVGNASVGVICDFADADAYHRYDADPEHNALRREAASILAGAVRVQFAVPH